MQANDSAGEQLENLALQRMRAGAVLAPLVQHDCARRGLEKTWALEDHDPCMNVETALQAWITIRSDAHCMMRARACRASIIYIYIYIYIKG
jgi:hypothetical protein